MSTTKTMEEIIKKEKNKQKGVSLLFVFLIMSVVLGIGLGISGILSQQAKMMGEMGFSVVAFFSADSGVERALFDLYKQTSHFSVYEEDLGNGSFRAEISCAKKNKTGCPDGFPTDDNCASSNFCIKSTGSYKNIIKRAIETQY